MTMARTASHRANMPASESAHSTVRDESEQPHEGRLPAESRMPYLREHAISAAGAS